MSSPEHEVSCPKDSYRLLVCKDQTYDCEFNRPCGVKVMMHEHEDLSIKGTKTFRVVNKPISLKELMKTRLQLLSRELAYPTSANDAESLAREQ